MFLWFFIFVAFYFLFKFPRIQNASAVCIITMLLIVGYELQVRSIGKIVATRTGQPYYPYEIVVLQFLFVLTFQSDYILLPHTVLRRSPEACW